MSVAVVACAGNSVGGSPRVLPAERGVQSTTPISHVIILIEENRSFDNLFATFPGADGATSGAAAPMPSPVAASCANKKQVVITQPTTVPLTKVSLTGKGFPGDFGWDNDLDHIYPGFQTDLDNGKMDGFDLNYFGPDGSGAQAACTYPYQYVDPKDIQPYWDLAKQYVLADQIFQTQGSSSFTAHQDLIAGATIVNYDYAKYGDNSIIDNPDAFPWGCDSPPGAKTSLITTSLKYLPNDGPSPCFTYETLRDLLDAKKVSWKYYAVAVHGASAGIWNAFDAIRAVREGSEWQQNIRKSPKDIFTDIGDNSLAAVSWITPDAYNSDHPDERVPKSNKPIDTGPSWIASVVNAIGQSSYWNSCAIIILWDDSGGFYDHESPAFTDDQGGLGFRVPMLVVSPYVQAHVEHTQYEFGSILKFVEKNWNLGSLNTTDARATAITNAFDFNQSPRKFKVIPSKYSRSFFLNQKPSGLPVDTE